MQNCPGQPRAAVPQTPKLYLDTRLYPVTLAKETNHVAESGLGGAACCVAGGPVAVAAEDEAKDAYVEPSSQISFPASLGGLDRRDVHTYEKRDLGVKIRYAGANGIKIDVYIYDGGKKNLGTGAESEAVKSHFAEVKSVMPMMVERGYYKDLVTKDDEQTVLETPSGKLTMLSVCFNYEETTKNGNPTSMKCISYSLLTAYKDHFIEWAAPIGKATRSRAKRPSRRSWPILERC